MAALAALATGADGDVRDRLAAAIGADAAGAGEQAGRLMDLMNSSPVVRAAFSSGRRALGRAEPARRPAGQPVRPDRVVRDAIAALDATGPPEDASAAGVKVVRARSAEDRPQTHVTVRPSRLVLVAGWVARPRGWVD